MKKVIAIILCWSMLCFLVGCGGVRNPQTPLLSEFAGKTVTHIYQQGEAALQDKRYNEAICSFKALNKLHPNNPHAQFAHIGLIDGYSALDQLEDALQEIDHFIRLYPNSKHIRLLQRKKVVLNRKKAIKAIKAAYEREIQKYRDAELRYRDKLKNIYRDLYNKARWEDFKSYNRRQYRAFLKSVTSSV